MITGQELKRYVALIPDHAVVTLGGNEKADIVGVKVESNDGSWHADLQITEGFSITKDSIIDSLFNALKR